ncbi:N-acetylglucosamine-6-phosphate deacetylase [Schaalia vaccimaxillae]|uniref:N-acetylglucosamine-6-phosphate deacetylase n=1 Tax=Schaalia vaccimaxillae TaxID=183916 RepID=UPI00047BA644|nr:amidohydrolase family protein [Schaalia vaccimaxillae]
MTTQRVLLRGRLVLSDRIIQDGVLVIEGEEITRVIDADEPTQLSQDDRSIVASVTGSDKTYLPGLVDVHCHGGGGESFPNAVTEEQAMTAVLEHRRHGTTSLVASCVTACADDLRARAATLAALSQAGELAGIHFEGPFVSHERCGAQDPAHIIDPDADLTRELLDICGGHCLSMTVAQEKPGAYGPDSVAEALIDGGAIPSWGHTDSGAVPAREAIQYSLERHRDSGSVRATASTITHLFNGMRPLHHRDTGPIGEFLAAAARNHTIVEVICDGIHVDPSLVRDVYEIAGRDQTVFVTDAMAAAGMADGDYVLGPQEVTVLDGVARLTQGGAIAGGTAHLLDCVRVAVQQAQIPLVDAVYMASVQGAKILGDTSIGRLCEGVRADIVEVDGDLRPVRVWRRGRPVD